MKTLSVRLPDDIYNYLKGKDKSISQAIRDILNSRLGATIYAGNYIPYLLDDFPVHLWDILHLVYQDMFDKILRDRREKDEQKFKEDIMKIEDSLLIPDFSRAIPLTPNSWKFFSIYDALVANQFLQNKGYTTSLNEMSIPYLHFIVEFKL